MHTHREMGGNGYDNERRVKRDEFRSLDKYEEGACEFQLKSRNKRFSLKETNPLHCDPFSRLAAFQYLAQRRLPAKGMSE